MSKAGYIFLLMIVGHALGVQLSRLLVSSRINHNDVTNTHTLTETINGRGKTTESGDQPTHHANSASGDSFIVLQLKSALKNFRPIMQNSRGSFFFNFSKYRGGSNCKKRILILMSDTGGGHRASAKALSQAMNDQFPGKFDVEIMDIWTDHANWPFNRFVPTYRYLAKHPLLWRAFYAYGGFPPTKLFTELWSWQNSYKSFRKAIESSNPDFVVSVHPLCQLMPISIVREMNKKRSDNCPIPFVTVVTDLGGAHKTWFDKRADMVFVPSKAVKDIALRNGIDPERIVLKGLPIRPSFWKESKSKLTTRKNLGLIQDKKTVLLMGGGDGVGGLDSIATEVAHQLDLMKEKSQLVVICGHNKKVSDHLAMKIREKNVHVVVKGFVENIDEFMSASDCLITKAGPGTIAESMIRGLPLILSSYLPGQVIV